MKKILLLTIVFAWMFTSCSGIGQIITPEAIIDGGFISAQPCSAPCFFGVSPGKTNFDQAESLLNESRYDLSCKTTLDTSVRVRTAKKQVNGNQAKVS